MKYRKLGRTGLDVSEIGFGSWAIGGSGYGPTRDEDSIEALETAWEHGINFYDTADTYGHGHSEEILSGFLKSKDRSKIFIASKAGWDFYHQPSRKVFTPEHLYFACEQSLKRLGAGHIDLYQLHNPDAEQIRAGEAVGALEKLKEQGKIRFIGISVHREEEALAALQDKRVDVIQLIFNMLDQRMADNVLDLCKEAGVGVIAREPLACGMLTGKYTADHTFGREDHRKRWTKEKLALDVKKIELIRSILSTERLPLSQAALEYVLDFDAVSVAIPGAKTKAQVLENLQATEDPMLRIQEASQIRDLYKKDKIFTEGLIPR